MDPIQQFTIKPLITLGKIVITNSALAMMLGCTCTTYVLWLLPQISTTFAGLAEIYFNFIDQLAKQTIKHDYEFLLPFISAVFLFLFSGNIIGLIPGFFTYTSHMSTDLFVSFTVISLVLVLSIIRHKMKFVQLFAPSGLPLWLIPLITPIEIFTFILRIFTLAIRICINMCVGHMTLQVFALLAVQFKAIGPAIGLIYIPFYMLEIGIAFLQAYIFTILTCVYLRDAVELGH